VSTSSHAALYGDGRLLRGHRLSATAVALAPDDGTAYVVTKCGAVLRWDLETCTKCAPHLRACMRGARSGLGCTKRRGNIVHTLYDAGSCSRHA
jgi:hypothetical protein